MSGGVLVVDASQPTSVFAQLKAFLLHEILTGAIGPNDQLPTEQELCARFGISRTPVHRALAELAAEGVVTRHRRRGTFVNPHWVAAHAGVSQLRAVVPVGSWGALLTEAGQENAALTLETVTLPELHDHLMEAVAFGTAPDLAVLDSVWVAEFANAGLLVPIDELDPTWVRDTYQREFASTFVSSHTIGGSVMAVQAEADVAGLWFDREALRDNGLRVPLTWPELASACKLLLGVRGQPPLTFSAGPAAGEAATYTLLAILASNGATVIDHDVVTLGSQDAATALAFVRELTVSGVVDETVTTELRERPIEMLAQGAAVFAFGGSYELPALADALGTTTDDAWERFGFAPMPHGPAGARATLAGGMALAVFRQSGNPRLAMRLIESIVSPASQLRMAHATGQVPSRSLNAADVPRHESLLGVSSALLANAVVRPPVASYDRMSQQLQQMFADVLTGRAEARAAASHTALLVAAITGLTLHAA